MERSATSAPDHQRLSAAGTRAALAGMAVAIAYGACFIVIRAALVYAPPLALAALRGIASGAALVVVAAVLRRPVLATGVRWPWLVAVALTSTTLGFAAMFTSQRWTSSGVASVLGNLQPLFVIALAAVFLRERFDRTKIAALVLGLSGVMLIVSPSGRALEGDLIALGASLSLALGNLLLKRLGSSPRVLAFSAWQLLIGGVPLLAISLLVEPPLEWRPELVGLVALLALPLTAMPYLAWNRAIARAEVGRLSALLFVTPAVGVVLAVLVDKETFTAAVVVGVALTLLAAALATVPAPAHAILRTRSAPSQRATSCGG